MENYTNYPELFRDLKLKQESEILYFMHHAGKDHFIKDLEKLPCWKHAEKIYLVDCEAWNIMIDTSWMTNKKIHLFAPVIHDNPQVHVYQFWFHWMQEIETYLNFYLKLKNLQQKPFYFDALLGTPRKHKKIIHKFINESPFRDKFLLSYYDTNYNYKHLVGSKIEDNQRMVYYHNKMNTNTSLVIPYLIYNQCWFSLVTETFGEGPIFYTEKTGKPLLSKKLFVMFASQHHLKHLQEFGFQTFHGIIDER